MRSARILRRFATIGAGTAIAAALAVPPVHAETTTTVPIPPSANCVSSLGTDLFCYSSSGTVTLTNHEDGTVSGALDYHFTCTGLIPCVPIHVTQQQLPRSGVVAGSPQVDMVYVTTVPEDVLCLNASCVPGFETDISAPTVSGTLATLWVAGTPVSVTLPPDVPGIDEILARVFEIGEDAGELADAVIALIQEQARKRGLEIKINRPEI